MFIKFRQLHAPRPSDGASDAGLGFVYYSMRKTMGKREITVFCANDGAEHRIEIGSTLMDLSRECCGQVTDTKTGRSFDVIAALVDNKLKDLSYTPVTYHKIEFIGFNSINGRKTYIRSLSFVLQNAVSEVFPEKTLIVDHSLPSGYYCRLQEKERGEDGMPIDFPLTEDDLGRIKEKMLQLIDRDLPFTRVKMPAVEAQALFMANGQPQKARLMQSIGCLNCSVYFLDGRADTFHGPLVPSTGCLKVFDLSGIGGSFCLQPPSLNDFSEVMPMGRQTKIASMLEEHSRWCSMIHTESIGELNKAELEGGFTELVNLAEIRHERGYAKIADFIYENRSEKRIVMIAGPSSSGKTSSSLRTALQCKALGLRPKVIELDNYFVDREKTPKDENGDYDFESLRAMDLELLNSQLQDLLDGKEVEIPKYDFKEGRQRKSGTKLHLEDKDILIMEGIHALNPEMTSAVDNSRILRVYVSALTSLNIDENNNLSTSDNRLLRRMVRDNRTRGIDPESTIMRWPSVRKGESRNIFPFQENADILFNSALIVELPVLKFYAEPLLMRIQRNSPAYTEAVRLLKLLGYIVPATQEEIAAIPPTSIIREFIGGQSLKKS